MTDDASDTHLFQHRTSHRFGAGPELVTLEGVRPGIAVPLLKERIELGRHPSNDIPIPSGSVSKRHAALIRLDGAYFIEDLGSTNGVLVNGVRLPVSERRRLYHGDNIRLSDQLFMYRQSHDVGSAAGSLVIELDMEKVNAEVAEALKQWRNESGEP
ncbi:MAG: FHA domain-containing protein [Planctomycetota bacterium]